MSCGVSRSSQSGERPGAQDPALRSMRGGLGRGHGRGVIVYPWAVSRQGRKLLLTIQTTAHSFLEPIKESRRKQTHRDTWPHRHTHTVQTATRWIFNSGRWERYLIHDGFCETLSRKRRWGWRGGERTALRKSTFFQTRNRRSTMSNSPCHARRQDLKRPAWRADTAHAASWMQCASQVAELAILVGLHK